MSIPFPVPPSEARLLIDLWLRQKDAVMANAMLRGGFHAERIWELGTGYNDPESWHALLDIRNIGPARVLHLVNTFRERGIEAVWFADFDRVSADWAALEGCPRVPPVQNPRGSGPDGLSLSKATRTEEDARQAALRASLEIQRAAARVSDLLLARQRASSDVRQVVSLALELSAAAASLEAIGEMRAIYETA